MYSESDIEAAVAAGAITPEAAAALRDSVAAARAQPAVDEESFRLLTGFNDIFVTIAAVLVLLAVGGIGNTIGSAIAPSPAWQGFPTDAQLAAMRTHTMATMLCGALLIAAASWGLAEFFTRRRRMALPSIVLLGSFVTAIGVAVLAVSGGVGVRMDTPATALALAIAGLVAAGGAYAHWLRFRVPITIAALTGALTLVLMGLFGWAVPAARDAWVVVVLLAGIAVFAFAMWWDMSDRARITRRSDVAFWLHLLAAPMIAHSVFYLLGISLGKATAVSAFFALLLYVLFGLVALAVDRRALLVSSLAYVLFAMNELFRTFGTIGLNLALTALVIGSALLTLSAFWHPIRRRVVLLLPPAWQARLPELDRPALIPRPA